VGPEKRAYDRISNEQRAALLDLLDSGITIREASAQMGIKYENAKAIYRVFRRTNRRTRQLKRLRRKVVRFPVS